VFDVVGVAALIVSGGWLIRRPRAPGVLLGGGLIIGGWTSNILDRLGLHNWTAPGSARGVVGFIPDGTPGRSNTADLCIALGAVGLGAALRPRPPEPPAPAAHRPGARAYVAALSVLAVAITLAVPSAMGHKGRYEPSAAPTAARPTCPDDQAGSVKSSSRE